MGRENAFVLDPGVPPSTSEGDSPPTPDPCFQALLAVSVPLACPDRHIRHLSLGWREPGHHQPLAFNPSRGPGPGHFNGSFFWRAVKHSSEEIIESRALGTQWVLCAHSRCPICLPSPTAASPLRTCPTLQRPTPAPPGAQLKGSPCPGLVPRLPRSPGRSLCRPGEESAPRAQACLQPIHPSIRGSAHSDVQRLLSAPSGSHFSFHTCPCARTHASTSQTERRRSGNQMETGALRSRQTEALLIGSMASGPPTPPHPRHGRPSPARGPTPLGVGDSKSVQVKREVPEPGGLRSAQLCHLRAA